MKIRQILAVGATSIQLVSMGGINALAEAPVPSSEETKSNIILEASPAITPPLDPENPDEPGGLDPNNPGTGEEGVLTIDSVPTIQFGTKIIETKGMVYKSENEHPFIQISDRRGTGEGWGLKAKISSFQTTGEAIKTLKGAELTLQSPEVKTTSENVSKAPEVPESLTLNGTDKAIFTAKEGQGKGTWLDVYSGIKDENEKISLAVPSGNEAGSYQATITWTLESAI
ncbi:WxL domain-containing protein [Carnobacterium maltaromaticum]|uniref:WxL domain-containing protein n=1 Tax=Carnobacterium maltaromaticum TaxID=2751 RepID=UPI0039B104C6